MKDGEERGFTAAEFKAAQAEGWEKQYPYKVGRKKEYMTPSAAEAQGLERASKYAKSTKYGRQNPISERWNSDEQLVLWREAWANAVNCSLERYGFEERVDHRSNAARGLDEQPTIHEGVIARAMEAKGILSDRCEINRQIKRDNALLRQIKAEFQKLLNAAKNTIPTIAKAMETLRANMIVMAYQVLYAGKLAQLARSEIDRVVPMHKKYDEIATKIKEKQKEKQALQVKQKDTPLYRPLEHARLNAQIAEVTEELEELKSEKTRLIYKVGVGNDEGVKRSKARIEKERESLQKAEKAEARYSVDLDDAAVELHDLETRAAELDPDELMDARLALREEQEQRAVSVLKDSYGKEYEPDLTKQAKTDVSEVLNEPKPDEKPRSMRKRLQEKQAEVEQRERKRQKKKEKDWER